VGPLCTAALFAAVTGGQFAIYASEPPVLAPYSLILLLPPVIRAVWSIAAGRPVVTGRLDQLLLGTDLLLVTTALLQGAQGTRSPMVVLLYATACALGLLFGARRIAPAIGIAAFALVVSYFVGAVAGGVFGLLTTLLGLLAFGFVPSSTLKRATSHASEARARLDAIEHAARNLGQDTARRQKQVRQASFTRAEEEAELEVLGERVQQWLWEICRTLVNGTGADRCLAYRPAAEGGDLHLAAHSADPGEVARSLQAREGVFGVVLKTGQPLMMDSVKQPYSGLVYVTDETPVGSLLVVPLLMEEQLWGVLVLDAAQPQQLGARDRAIVEGVVPLLLSLLDQLADLTAYRRGSSEQRVLHASSQALAEQGSLEDLSRTLVSQSQDLVDGQAGALVMLDREAMPAVVAAYGFDRDPTGVSFPFDSTTSLVAQCIRYDQIITRSLGESDRRQPALFGEAHGPVRGLSELMVVPLIRPASEGSERTAIGALVLARRGARPFGEDERERIGMLVYQAAAHILNIRLLEESRTQAATDGLTGLPNRRSFVDKLEEMLQRSDRFGTPVSLLMLDVDHFKSVNDTYGHPVGDQVLQKLAELLAGSVRDTVDMAARYGGEEFTVLLENTSHEGAVNLAERLREALAAETFVHVEGSNTIPFRVTMSLGVATSGEGGEPAELVERADQALYAAKEGGRNQVVSG